MVDKIKKSIILPKKRKTADDLYYKNQAKKLLPFKKMNQRDLVDLESSLGATIFGAIPEGHRREFFNVDNDTWIWHEEWLDNSGQRRIKTTRYDVRPNGILKAQDGQHYQKVSRQEAGNLHRAAQVYHQRIKAEIYNLA